jgi:hypothetical protein
MRVTVYAMLTRYMMVTYRVYVCACCALSVQIQHRASQGFGERTLFDIIAVDDIEAIDAYAGDFEARNSRGMTAIMYACARRRAKSLSQLLHRVEVPVYAVNALKQHYTTLMYACVPPVNDGDGDGDETVPVAASAIAGAGAPLSASAPAPAAIEASASHASDGETCVAALLPHIPTVVLNAKCDQGDTALHLAARNGYFQTVALLLKRTDINVAVANAEGDRPFDVAVKHGHSAIATLLATHAGYARMHQIAAEAMVYQSVLALPTSVLDAFVTALANIRSRPFTLAQVHEHFALQANERTVDVGRAGAPASARKKATVNTTTNTGKQVDGAPLDLFASTPLVRQLLTYMMKVGTIVFAQTSDAQHLLRIDTDAMDFTAALNLGAIEEFALTWDGLMQITNVQRSSVGQSSDTAPAIEDDSGKPELAQFMNVDRRINMGLGMGVRRTGTPVPVVLTRLSALARAMPLDQHSSEDDLLALQRAMLSESEVAGLATAPVFQYIAALKAVFETGLRGLTASTTDVPELIRRASIADKIGEAGGYTVSHRVDEDAPTATAFASSVAVHAQLARGLRVGPGVSFGALTATSLRDAVSGYIQRAVHESTDALDDGSAALAREQAEVSKQGADLARAKAKATRLEAELGTLRAQATLIGDPSKHASAKAELERQYEAARKTRVQAEAQYAALIAKREAVSTDISTSKATADREVANADLRVKRAQEAITAARAKQETATARAQSDLAAYLQAVESAAAATAEEQRKADLRALTVEARAEVAVAVERVRVEALKAERQAVAAARQSVQSEAVRVINERIVDHKKKMAALRGEAARLTAEIAADVRRCSADALS